MSRDIDISTLGLEEAYNAFKVEVDTMSKDYKQARFGKNIRFDINIYLRGHIIIKHKIGKAYILGKVYDIEDIYTELEERERIIKDWLHENMGTEGVANPRD